jgi:hypothetical protein
MKPRHTAALVLVGWYLLVPHDMLQSPPVSDWEHYASYDTAKECESAKSELGREAVKSERLNGCETTDPHLSTVCHYDFAKENAQCVSTDDSRLNGN